MRLLIVLNPVSGGDKKESFLEDARKLCHKHEVEYSVFETKGKGDKERLRGEVDSFRPDRVASVGGDGTILLTATVLMGTSLPMGIVPMGSANGLAEELEIDTDILDALTDIILSDRIVGLDMIEVNEKYHSIHIGDVGLNARIVESYEKDPKRGITTYAKYFLDEMGKASTFNVKVTTNKKESVKKKALMVAICNSRKFGTGIPLTLDGDPMDGKFELVIIEEINISSLIKMGLAKFNDRFFDNQLSTILTATKAEIMFDEPRLLQLDGEVIGEFEALKIRIIPGAASLILKKSSS
jgi:YegS/Rv2252/BmrU family lipid kinase